MKKLFSMMLMLCAIVTFSACSSDEEGETNVSPVTNVVMPKSIKIGAEATIQGVGFTSNQDFYLREANNFGAIPVKLTDVKVSTSGITFTVPYELTEGQTVNFSVSQDNKDWILGTTTVLGADNPVSAVSIPSEMPLLSEVTITGTGFADGDRISIAASDENERIYLDATVVDGGIQVDTYTALEGVVNVYLKRGNSEWKIGQTYSYFPRVISSITVSNNTFLSNYALMIGLTGNALKLEMKYDKNYALQSVTSNSALAWNLSYSGNTVSFTGQLTGMPYTFTLDDQKRIISSTGADMYGDAVKYTWNYDADGYLVSITQDGSKDVLLSATYTDNSLSAYTFGIDCGASVDNSKHAFLGTAEPTYLLNSFAWIVQHEELFIGFLLNQNVKTSSYVLNKFSAEDINEDGSSFETSVAVASELGENSLTLETSGDCISNGGGLYCNKVAVAYEIKSKE